MKTYLNLGCGRRYHPQWTNYDLSPNGPGVIAHDLSTGIPHADNSCDVIYHSHVLEHLRRVHALPFLRECHRVLKPGGIIRTAVPDLEHICRSYLACLDRASNGNHAAASDYDWVMLEFYDQVVRERSGGEMLAYLQRDPIPNEEFVLHRIGEEGREILRCLREPQPPSNGNTQRSTPFSLRTVARRFRQFLLEKLLRPSEIQALKLGQFRLAGEVHCWMYDRYSLGELMKQSGFIDPVRQSADTSRLPNWKSFHLDTQPDGTVVKPDSLFMEAVKPPFSGVPSLR